VPWITRKLKLQSSIVAPPTMIAMESPQGERQLRSFLVEAELAVADARIDQLPLPGDAAVTMIDHRGTMVAASAASVLRRGDYVYVLYSREDAAEIELLFGPPAG